MSSIERYKEVDLDVSAAMVKLTFGRWLRVRRQVMGITQSDLAKILDVTTQTVRNWEKGKTFPTLDIRLIGPFAEIIGVSVQSLINALDGVEVNDQVERSKD